MKVYVLMRELKSFPGELEPYKVTISEDVAKDYLNSGEIDYYQEVDLEEESIKPTLRNTNTYLENGKKAE